MRKLGWLLAALIIGLGLLRLGVLLGDRGGPAAFADMQEPEPQVGGALAEIGMMAVFVLIGAFVTSRRPRHPVGWLLLMVGLAFAVLLLAERLGWHYLIADERVSARAARWLWLADWFWIGAVVPLFIGIPLLFPGGRPASPRWRWFMIAVLVNVAAFAVATALGSGRLENYPVENPFGVSSFFPHIRNVLFGGVIAAAFVSIGSLFFRFRRAQGMERQQIKWLWVAGGVLLVGFIASSGLDDSDHSALGDSLLLAALLAIPAAVAVAMLRYRLFDVDVVVNRTLVYGGLTASLAAVYLGGVLLFGLVLAPITSDSGLAVAISTLAVAALFRPVRARIQALVDRRFYRRRYDAAVTLDAFSARLRDEIDLDSLVRELGGVVEQTVQPSHVSLWLRPRG